MLEPGEKKRVTVELDDNAFKTYDTSAHDFVPDAGTYEIKVGASVRKILLKKEVEVSAQESASSYKADKALYEEFFSNCFYEQHHKGTFTSADNLCDMAKESLFVKLVTKIILRIFLFSARGKSKNDPSVKIAISAILENPLESLISITKGVFSEKLVAKIVRAANR